MLSRKSFFVREHIGFMKLSDTYDILDPETQAQIGIAKEKPGGLVHVLRFLVNKKILPTKVFVYQGSDFEAESQLLFSIQRGFTLLRSRIKICDQRGTIVGSLQSKLFSLGGAFRVFDALGNELFLVKGDWKGWNFRFLDLQEQELGTITKKWAGIGRELFTSADNYMIALTSGGDPSRSLLLLAAGLAVDTVYKER